MGSSATRHSGSAASVRAMAIRCRWPPLNSCGYFSAASGGRPTRSSSSVTRCTAAFFGSYRPAHTVADQVADGAARIEGGVRFLEDHLQLPHGTGSFAAAQRGHRLAIELDRSCCGRFQADHARPNVDLPQPDHLPGRGFGRVHGQVDSVDGPHPAVAATIIDAQTRDLHQRCHATPPETTGASGSTGQASRCPAPMVISSGRSTLQLGCA